MWGGDPEGAGQNYPAAGPVYSGCLCLRGDGGPTETGPLQHCLSCHFPLRSAGEESAKAPQDWESMELLQAECSPCAAPRHNEKLLAVWNTFGGPGRTFPWTACPAFTAEYKDTNGMDWKEQHSQPANLERAETLLKCNPGLKRIRAHELSHSKPLLSVLTTQGKEKAQVITRAGKKLKGCKRDLSTENLSGVGNSTASQSIKCKIWKVNPCLPHAPSPSPGSRNWEVKSWQKEL